MWSVRIGLSGNRREVVFDILNYALLWIDLDNTLRCDGNVFNTLVVLKCEWLVYCEFIWVIYRRKGVIPQTSPNFDHCWVFLAKIVKVTFEGYTNGWVVFAVLYGLRINGNHLSPYNVHYLDSFTRRFNDILCSNILAVKNRRLSGDRLLSISTLITVWTLKCWSMRSFAESYLFSFRAFEQTISAVGQLLGLIIVDIQGINSLQVWVDWALMDLTPVAYYRLLESIQNPFITLCVQF